MCYKQILHIVDQKKKYNFLKETELDDIHHKDNFLHHTVILSATQKIYPLANCYITMERSTILNGNTHYFYGHVQQLCGTTKGYKVICSHISRIYCAALPPLSGHHHLVRTICYNETQHTFFNESGSNTLFSQLGVNSVTWRFFKNKAFKKCVPILTTEL